MLSVIASLTLALEAVLLVGSHGASAIPQVAVEERSINSSIVTWDDHSLMIDGKRVMIYSAEVHAFRYPGYSSWVEVLQKLKAAGFNTVSTYFFWGMIEHRRGDFNWDGFRDPQAFFDAAKEAGVWVISRPGPYINAEVSSGGFPGWLQRIPGPARNSREVYTEAWLPYLSKAFEITARNQIDRGGPVIALQLENEYDEAPGGEDKEYGRLLKQAAIDAGITVPTTHNGGMNLKLENYLIDNVEIWGYDEYPATSTVCPGPDRWPADAIKQFHWSEHLSEKFNRGQPMAIYEFEGGFKQSWGDAGYCSELGGVDFQKMFFKNKYAMATTIFSIYMAWGGTNWGNLASPDCYTSYDFGAMVTEERMLRSKYYEAKTHAQFLRTSPAFLTAFPQNIDENINAYVDSSPRNLTVTMSLDVEGRKTKFFFTRHTDASYTGETEYTLNLPTSHGDVKVPQLGGKLSLYGRDTKVHVVDYQVGDYSLLYSSAEVFTSLVIDGVTVVVLYGDHGQTHETSIITPKSASYTVFGDNDLTRSFNISRIEARDESQHTIVLNYQTMGKSAVKVGDDLLLYILDRETAYLTWPDLENNALVFGGYAIRSAKTDGRTFKVVGDLNSTTKFEFVAPKAARGFTFNGRRLSVASTKYGTKTATVEPMLPEVSLPDLQTLTWKAADSLPELSEKYDDSRWVEANITNTTNPNTPETPVSLYSGDYGYHTGHILWRGHFKALGGETKLSLNVYGGKGFAYSAFDNGRLINSFNGAKNNGNNAAVFDLASEWKEGEEHVITILQDHMGYAMSWTANKELYKDPRGIFGYNFTTSDGTLIKHTDATWKVQGNLGGEDYIDQTRGPFNEGGLYGERVGWHLPRFPDAKWERSSPFDGIEGAGVKFYRTTFDLKVPDNVDYPISIQLPSIAPKSAAYRAVIYVNGYQFGRYSSTLGPQTRFPIPPSILDLKGQNTLAIALWSLSSGGASISSLSLNIDAKIDYGGPKFRKNPMPSHKASERKGFL